MGGVVCRVDELSFSNPGAHALLQSQAPNSEEAKNEGKEIYIQSLALLSPFRGKGLVSFALEEIISLATSHSNETENENKGNIKGLYAHVWTQNQDALEWYSKQGFVKATAEKDAASGVGFGGVITGYYRKLKPDTAFLLRRELKPSDYLHSAAPSQISTSQPKTQDLKKEEVENRPKLGQTRSFQDRGPEREWNDLPVDVVGNGLLKVNGGSTGSSSRASSRGGDANGKGKKKRVYPAAAFAG